MSAFFTDLKLSHRIHFEQFRRFYRDNLSAEQIHVLDSRSPLGDLVGGDVIIQTKDGSVLSVEEKVSRNAGYFTELCLILEISVTYGKPTLSRLTEVDLLAWAFLFQTKVEIYALRAKCLAKAINKNFNTFARRRLLFPGGADVEVLFIPLTKIWEIAGAAKAIHWHHHNFFDRKCHE
jgi:hypothetical protein